MGFKKIITSAIKNAIPAFKAKTDAAAAAAKDTADRTAALRSMRRLDEEDVKEMGLKKGGKVMFKEMKEMKKKGRGVAKADMQKVATKAVKGHEKRMHGTKKAAAGGMMKYAPGGKIDGCAAKGKTKGRMV